eukprot:1154595-Pelagomonas_calceolata.AAC.5
MVVVLGHLRHGYAYLNFKKMAFLRQKIAAFALVLDGHVSSLHICCSQPGRSSWPVKLASRPGQSTWPGQASDVWPAALRNGA